jgi:hypothetical protein
MAQVGISSTRASVSWLAKSVIPGLCEKMAMVFALAGAWAMAWKKA